MPPMKNSNWARGCSVTELVGLVINLAWLAVSLALTLALVLSVAVVVAD